MGLLPYAASEVPDQLPPLGSLVQGTLSPFETTKPCETLMNKVKILTRLDLLVCSYSGEIYRQIYFHMRKVIQ
ncbi:hypothetical protein DPMN_100167 [Dreissena polymorpha]|uniref:Uncharacterized protein n=1 Tax=Dreissena polymorpha TaxID=45954 RepID=A0A9D4LFA1_DREPO|nr:hypothetical protein DPMN_100167 [Dreissena polymorpha]